MTEITEHISAPARHARDFATVFLHDWRDVTMIHFQVEPARLQPMVPFDLHTFRGQAYVTLVFFRLDRMRTPACPRLSRLALRPISDHRFLNIRTYVKHQGEPGIFFLTEYLENRLSVLLGPLTYGLPYRLGRFNDSTVRTPNGQLTFRAQPSRDEYQTSKTGSLDEFLFERYSAFTRLRGQDRVFRIRHEPWPQRPVDIELTDTSLLTNTEPWFPHATICCAHQSPGLVGVELSRPLHPEPANPKGA